MNALDDNELWDRLPGETVKNYEKFCRYRDMKNDSPTSTRSIRKLADEKGIKRNSLELLSKKYNWVNRAEAYDLYMVQKIKQQNEADILKMRKDHAMLASQVLKKATRRLLTMPEEQISASDLVRLVDIGVKVERLSRGESTENNQISGEAKIKHSGEIKVNSTNEIDFSNLSDKELSDLERIFNKISPESEN